MDISIVVPFHNVEAYIGACVDALASQRFPADRFEIIMVDNNSTDGSAAIVRRHPNVRLLAESKPGSYAARNRGVAAASGSIIAFIDSDCVADPGWLQAIANAMASPEVALVQGRRRLASESAGLAMLADYEGAKAAYTFGSRRPEIYYGYTNNMAVRRHIFDQVGPFEEWLRGADVVFVSRVVDACSGDAVRYVPEMSVRHLEVASVATWFRKMYIYGGSFRRYGKHAARRPLNAAERLEVLRATVRAHHYSRTRTLLLNALLGIGVVCYELGRRLSGSRA